MNKKGFTLIELLAVVVILGVIMTVAIPNVVSTIDKNKKETFIEDAKKIISAAEYKIRSDTEIEYPDESTITVLTLNKIGTDEVDMSPFDTYYSKSQSFVAITKELDPNSSNSEYMYVYYIHLVSCPEEECVGQTDDSATQNRGIILRERDALDSSDKYDLVEKGASLNLSLIEDEESIKEMLRKDRVDSYK